MKAREKKYLSSLLQNASKHADEIDPLAIAVALPACRNWIRTHRSDILAWLQNNAPAETQVALMAAMDCAGTVETENAEFANDPFLCEKLLAFSATKQRRQQGTYYTPQPLAEYLVARIDQALMDQFGLRIGLADTTTWGELIERGTIKTLPPFIDPKEPFVQLLDPALGSGMFPITVLRHVYAKLVATDQAEDWQQTVHSLLPRLHGWELSLPGLVAAVVQLTTTLAAMDYAFRDRVVIPWQLRDALTPPSTPCAATILLGNPPYSALSTAKHGWLEALISDPTHGYTTLHGEPLGEKKHWLHDDYVKFIRLAQWQIEQVHCGIVGLVTNHGYLENVSFRGMRASLCKTFPQIEIVDLQGNAKNRSLFANQTRDENVFGIASGVALNLFVRPPHGMPSPRLMHHTLQGSRASKLERLSANSLGSACEIQPTSPLYLFAPRREMVSTGYQESPSLCEIMPFRASAPVTARDHFTVAFTKAELLQRLSEFRDLAIPADTIRKRYFQRTRSAKYDSGDTRGWKLATAREALAEDANWASCVREVQYRPMDVRYIAWHSALIDWPRTEFARHMLMGENIALIARRQSPAHQPANFFWATSQLTLDGILRSDNRGNESLFPLWLYDAAGQKSPNFSADWMHAMESITHLNSSPRELLAYLYGCFFSTAYRQAHHVGLVHDYPRVPYPRDRDEFKFWSQRGEQLLQLHAESYSVSSKLVGSAVRTNVSDRTADPTHFTIAPGYPRWEAGKIFINANDVMAEADEATWNFTIGTHQVARKWLKDRLGRTLSNGDMQTYKHLLVVLQSTQHSLGD